MNLEKIYTKNKALLKGHFKLSSLKHSAYYLQSAKVLQNPKTAKKLAKKLAKKIIKNGIKVDTVCSPAIGGLIIGYALAEALKVDFIFSERIDSKMSIKRGFEVKNGNSYIICEDIITTGGSALEAANVIKQQKGNVVAYVALANRGYCKIDGSNSKDEPKEECVLPLDSKLITLGEFKFETYEPKDCPICKEAKTEAIKPGSRV
jgi:orotate phosphoribosyltransferase